jgi:hypothetical protein
MSSLLFSSGYPYYLYGQGVVGDFSIFKARYLTKVNQDRAATSEYGLCMLFSCFLKES